MGGIVAGAIFLFSVFNPMPTSELSMDISSPPPTKAPIHRPKPPSPTPSQIIHKVESGDTLYTIADEFYGGEKYWTNLWNDNDWIEDPRFIKSGWELKITNSKPDEVEKLSPKLAIIYEEITAPTPSPEPTKAVAGVSTNTPQGAPGSFDGVYQQAGARYGIPWEILYGLHHMETGGRDGAITSGYGTGAQGPLQFMPGTWATYGIDGNGDGNADINNAMDAIFGAANFIAAHGGVEQGLRSYGGDSQIVLNYARSRGYNQ